MGFLTPDKIKTEHGLEIKEKIIPWGAVWPKDSGGYKKGDLFKADRLLSNGTGKVEYVTIHNTADINEASGTNDAEQYTRATWPNANMNEVRVHYYIDETDCWQNLREDEVGWHAADGRGPGNESSIAIEIIMDGSGSAADKAAEDRGALLAAILLDRYKLGIDRLKTHKDWYNQKYCPLYILPHWDAFKAKVKKYLDDIQKPATQNETIYRVQTGAYRDKNNAIDLLNKVKAAGFDGYIVEVDNLYKVQVGAYKVIENANKMRDSVKANGFDAFITTKGGQAVGEIQDNVVSAEIVKGSVVKIRSGANYYNSSVKVPSWVIEKEWIVSENPSGSRVVIDKSTDGENAINSAIDKKFLTLVVSGAVEEWKPKIGDLVNYTGDVNYENANATTGYKCKGGLAKITNISNLATSKHPYHLVRVAGKGASVHGWVDAGTFTKA